MAGPTIGTIRGTIEIDYDGKGIIKATDDVDGLDKTSSKTSKNLDGLARGLGLFGAAIAGGFAVATASAVSFEKRMSAVAAVSGASAAEMDLLSKKALQLGADTKFSASEAALAIEELVKAGLSVGDVLGGAADAVVALAAAGEIDLPQAATIAANAMNQFGLAAKDLPKVVDNIAGAANASAIDVGEFGFSLSQVGAVAHLAGQTFEDTATAIALLGNAGIKGSDAGTSLKTFLSNLVPTTKTAKAAFEQLGLAVGESGNAFVDAQGNYKSLGEIAGILHTATTGLSEAQRQVALETIFGSDAIRAAAIIAEQGSTGFNDLATAMNKTTAADVAATRMDNAAGSIEQLKGSVETLGISIGSKFTPVLQKLADQLNGLVNGFGELSGTTQAIILSVVALIGTLSLLVAAVIKVSKAIKAIQLAVTIIKAWTIWTKIAVVWTKIWTAAQWLLSAAMNSTFLIVILVIAIIAALVAAIIWLWKNNETFRKVVMAVWAAVKKAIAAVVDWLVNKAWPLIQKVWSGIVDGAKWLWGWITKIFKAIVDSIKFQVGILLKVWDFIAPVVKSVFGLVVSIIKLAFSIISAIFSVFLAITKFTFNAIWFVIKTTFDAILVVTKAVWGFIGPYVIAIVQAIWNFIKIVWDGIVTATTTAFNFVKGIITAVWGFIGPYVIATAQAIWDFLVKAWGVISTVTETVWNGIKDFFGVVWGAVVAIFTTARDNIVAIIDGIKVIVDKIREFFGKLKEAADKGIGPLFDFVKQIPGKILGALGDVGSMLFDSGRKLIQGFIDGILKMADKVKDAGKSVLNGLRNLFPFSPAKEGPFSGAGWTFNSGTALIEDFAKGIDKASATSLDSLTGALSGVAASFSVGGTPSTVAPASTTNVGGAINVGSLNVNGVWDFTDPMATRKMVGQLDKELNLYKNGFK